MSIPSQHHAWLNLAQQKLPLRSRLNHQAPIALKAPFVESLSSYIRRIAQSHCLYPGTIIHQEIALLSQRKSRQLQLICHESGKAVNGFGDIAEDIIQALETLTLRSDLRFLTLIPLAKVLQKNDKLCRSNQAWCPICYEHCKLTKEEVYDPLIWTIDVVKICPAHNYPLQDQCPQCRQAFFVSIDFHILGIALSAVSGLA